MIAFSVIIPAYNRAGLIRATLDSVVATDAQLIVIDDGSTDGTRDVAAAYGDRVTLLTQQNRGPGAARNLGLSAASGDYVAFLDSDDVWFPWTLDVYRKVITDTSAEFIVGKPLVFEFDTMPPAAKDLQYNRFTDYFQSGDQWRWYSASSFVMRRQTLIDAGGFTEDWVNAEDADAAMRMGVAAGFIQIKSPATFGYRKHSGSAMANWDRTLDGVTRLVDQEGAGKFPGGSARAFERRRIISTYARPLTLELLAQHRSADAWRLYRRTLGWNLSLRRWKYLAGFPVAAAVRKLRPVR